MNYQMDQNIRANGTTINFMGEGNSFTLMVAYMMVTGIRGKQLAKANIFRKMELFVKYFN